MAEIKWKELDGELKVVVQAFYENGNYRVFHFNVYVDKNINTCDKREYVKNIIKPMVLLRNCFAYKVLFVDKLSTLTYRMKAECRLKRRLVKLERKQVKLKCKLWNENADFELCSVTAEYGES